MSATTSRLAWALAGVGALAAAVMVRAQTPALFTEAAPVRWTCLGLAVVCAGGALGPARLRDRLSPALAALRLALVLLTMAVWRGDAREVWGALAVWVAWRDVNAGMAGRRPLVPVAVGMLLALAWDAHRPGPAAGRAILVALVAALAADRADADRRAHEPGSEPSAPE